MKINTSKIATDLVKLAVIAAIASSLNFVVKAYSRPHDKNDRNIKFNSRRIDVIEELACGFAKKFEIENAVEICINVLSKK